MGAWLSYGTTATGQRFTLRVETAGADMVLRCEVMGSYTLGSTPLDNGEWHHVAVVVDDLNESGSIEMSELRFYVDGNPDLIVPGSGTISTGTAFPLAIGGSAHNTGYHYSGGIDDVRIYPEALAGSNIAELSSRNAFADAWHFRETMDAMPDATDWNTDDEGDGFTRFMEFAMGGTVNASESNLGPWFVINPSNQIELKFRRRIVGLPQESYVPQVSSLMLPETWSTATGPTSTDPDPDNPLLEWVTFVPNLDDSPLWPWFFRLQLSQP